MPFIVQPAIRTFYFIVFFFFFIQINVFFSSPLFQVRVPMVCQYAHKLAYLVGESVHKQPAESLETLLYYL